MNWYYVSAGQQAGPVEEAQLEDLFRTGKIQAETLVWKEGMANWQPYREVKPVTAQSVHQVTRIQRRCNSPRAAP